MFRTIAEPILYHYMNSYARLFPVRTIDVKLARSVREVFFKQVFPLHINIVYPLIVRPCYSATALTSTS
ncbi:MAG: hypothetical protein ACK415_03260 [Thermodesulfovibrionales bacterium]